MTLQKIEEQKGGYFASAGRNSSRVNQFRLQG